MSTSRANGDAGTGARSRLLTGDRPTGALHLGHLVGTLRERVARQDDHDCLFIVADLHTLTTRPQRDHLAALPEHVRDVVLDQLAVGIDPTRCSLYLQSGVPAVYELAILLQMLVTTRRLDRLESLAAMADVAGTQRDAMSLGLLGYPVLQAADILVARAELVPVGRDNEPHVELAREIAAAFNDAYGPVFPLPSARVAQVQTLPGIDGAKMSKSAGNAILLKDPREVVTRKLAIAAAPVLGAWIEAFVDDPAEALEALARGDAAGLAAARHRLESALDALLSPIRERRSVLEADEGLVAEILVDGTLRVRELANATMATVREAMALEPLWRGIVEATQRRAEARKRPVYG